MELYQRCYYRWFGLDLRNNVYSQCRYCNRNNIFFIFFSAENKLALSLMPSDLQKFIQIEEMLIVRVYIHVQVISICGAQYKYSGYIVNFLYNVGTVYSQFPRLLKELDVIILRPYNAPIYDRLRRQFRRNFHMRRKVIRTWFGFFKAKYLGYRDIVINNIILAGLPFNDIIIDYIFI